MGDGRQLCILKNRNCRLASPNINYNFLILWWWWIGVWGELFDLLVLKELQLRSGKGDTCMENFSFQIMMKERSTCNLLWEAYPPPPFFVIYLYKDCREWACYIMYINITTCSNTIILWIVHRSTHHFRTYLHLTLTGKFNHVSFFY